MNVDADVDLVKLAAAGIDFGDPEAVARLILRTLHIVFPECIAADGSGCTPGSMVLALAHHFGADKRLLSAGIRRAVKNGWLVRVGRGSPMLLKRAPGWMRGE